MAGGTGSRLWPITRGISKQLLPVFDKPLIHYPISTLFLAGIREIIIITTPHDSDQFKFLLGTGESLGVKFHYLVQNAPEGLAQAFTLSESYISGKKTALVLGDNIFHGPKLGSSLSENEFIDGARIFAYQVADPERYGVVEFDQNGMATSIEEKPKTPKSNYAVPGLYFYDEDVLSIAKSIKKSARGELEITSVNEVYLENDKLNVSVLPRGTAWLDTGTFDSLHDAGTFIKTMEDRQGVKIACLEEISYRNAWISRGDLLKLANEYGKSQYGEYLRMVAEENIQFQGYFG